MKIKKSQQDAVSLFEKFAGQLAAVLPKKTQPSEGALRPATSQLMDFRSRLTLRPLRETITDNLRLLFLYCYLAERKNALLYS